MTQYDVCTNVGPEMNEIEPLAEMGLRLKPAQRLSEHPKPPTKAQTKLINGAVAMKKKPNDGTPAYLAKYLVQCTLPHTDPGDVPLWKRENGKYTLMMQQGMDLHSQQPIGYPYGTLPRLILIWIVTEAIQEKKRRLVLGNSFAEFLRKLDLDPRRHDSRSDARRLQDQLRRLLNCQISFHESGRKTYHEKSSGRMRLLEGERVMRGQLSSETMFWWDVKKPHHNMLFESYIELSADFYESLLRHKVVPFHLEAVKMLRRSPLALDLYVLCVWTAHNLKAMETKTITWKYLEEQLGCDYASRRDLRTKVKAAMRKVLMAYPGLRMRYISGGGGFEVLPSVSPVQPREARPAHSATAR